MGCWNETCFISKLPIFHGDHVVMILLRGWDKATKDYTPEQCYADEIWSPLGLPIYGTYDDYGSLEDILNLDDVVEYLSRIKFVSKDENLPTTVTTENFNEFLDGVISDRYTYNSLGHNNVTCIMIKADLYNRLITDYGKRDVRKWSSETHGMVSTGHTIREKAVKMLHDELDRIKTSLDEHGGKNEDFRNSFLDVLLFSSGILNGNAVGNRYIVQDYLAKRYINEKDNASFEYLVEIVLFRIILENLRSGYGTYSGSGSQGYEMLLHRIVANFILEETDNYVKKYREESADNCEYDDILSDIPYCLL